MLRKVSTFFVGLAVVLCATVSSCTTQTFNPRSVQPSYITVETNSGRILFASNIDMKRPIGMLVNIATAMVAIDWIEAGNISMETKLIVPETVLDSPYTNLMRLKPGDRITLRDALHGTIMTDDSACAATLARACGLTLSSKDPEGAFVAQMNQLAKTLGMKGTVFKDTSGSGKSLSTARDMATLSMYAILRPSFQSISAKDVFHGTVWSASGQARHAEPRKSHLHATIKNVDGLRSALSTSAGYCLAASRKHASVKRLNPETGKMSTYGQRLLVVIIGAHTQAERKKLATGMLNDGWGVWDRWLQSKDFSDTSCYITLPH